MGGHGSGDGRASRRPVAIACFGLTRDLPLALAIAAAIAFLFPAFTRYRTSATTATLTSTANA